MKEQSDNPNRCCDNGDFGDGHACQKMPAESPPPPSPLSIPSIKAEIVKLEQARALCARNLERYEGAKGILVQLLAQAENHQAAMKLAEQ